MGSVQKRVFVAAVILAATFAAHGQDFDRATLLVASAGNPTTQEGMVLIVAPANDGHVSFFVDRQSSLKRVSDSDALQSTYALVRRDAKRSDVTIGVVMDVSSRTMDRIVRESPDEARYFASFVNWSEGQLQREIDAGMWTVRKPDESSLFTN
jgi:hypothetical protein